MRMQWALDRAVDDKKRIFRGTWPRGDFVFLIDGSQFFVNRPPLMGALPEGTSVEYAPHFVYCVAGNVIREWSPTNEDLLAADWDLERD